jgi:hypothetical protein
VRLRRGRSPLRDRRGPPHSGARQDPRLEQGNLLNIGIHRTPEAKYLAWVDADIMFRRHDWAVATLHALQHYDVVQPWGDAYDLGPNGEHIAHHRSFCRQYFHRLPMFAASVPYGRGNGGFEHPHPGYAWAITRQAFDWLGGLYELGGMGSGDHHMALALIGEAERSMPAGTTDAYRAEVRRWQARALRHINLNIGYVPGTIEHLFHRHKTDRGYQSRWCMFVKHARSIRWRT